VSLRTVTSWLASGLLLISACGTAGTQVAWGQEKINRTVKIQVAPVYPDLARRMRITGTVKVKVAIAPNGTVKDATVVGGHPVLANAALDAARKWRYEASADETTGVVEFHFDLHQ